MTTGCTHVCIVGPLPLIVVAAVSLAAQSSSEAELVGRTRSSRRQRADAAAALLEDKVACEGGAGVRTKGAELIRVSPRGRRSRQAGWFVRISFPYEELGFVFTLHSEWICFVPNKEANPKTPDRRTYGCGYQHMRQRNECANLSGTPVGAERASMCERCT